jgi:hypothetical protein
MAQARGGGFGLDADLAKKAALKYDVGKEQEATQWMEQILGERLTGRFQDFLKDGTVLCRVLNTIKPGTIRKIESSKCERLQGYAHFR